MNNYTIGFANFKAFGEKNQPFTRKPITLVYGPNSVGKSSFLHMLMYKNYVTKTNNPNLIHTDMFGDSLDIGGFENFVHNHDSNNIICFEESSEKSDKCLGILTKFLRIKIDQNNLDYMENLLSSKTLFVKKTSIKMLFDCVSDRKFEIEITYKVDDKDLISFQYLTDSKLDNGSFDIVYLKTYSHPLFDCLNLPIIEISDVNLDYCHSLELNEEAIREWKNLLNTARNDDYGDSVDTLTFEADAILRSFDYKLIKEIEKNFDYRKTQYIGPLRFYPNRGQVSSDNQSNRYKNDIYSSVDMWKILLDSSSDRHSLLGKVNGYLKKLGMDYMIQHKVMLDIADIADRADIESIPREQLVEKIIKATKKYELTFKDLKRNINLSNRDLGLGISQVLPILIATSSLNGTQIIIEQPELHLHPKAQCELADIFIENCHESTNKSCNFEETSIDFSLASNNFIIETHSEHLLLRIMKRMRETAEGRLEDQSLRLTPNDVCLLYVDSHKGKTFMRELRLDVDGSLLSRWPNGFFEESYREMFPADKEKEPNVIL
jgi:predicted ATPase